MNAYIATIDQSPKIKIRTGIAMATNSVAIASHFAKGVIFRAFFASWRSAELSAGIAQSIVVVPSLLP